jgi:hypothetical protein
MGLPHMVRPSGGSVRFGAVRLGLLFCLAVGCASTPPEQRVVLAGSPVRSLLILPLNATAVMPAELETSSGFVWEELEVYLRAQGKQLKTVAPEIARRFWLASIQRARAGEKGAKAGFDDAVRILVRKLAEYAEFDTVLVPSLFVRQANIAGESARWDGVVRAVEFEETSRTSPAIPANSPLVGVAPAATLHMVVFDADGNRIQEAMGGLELLVQVRVLRPGTDTSEPIFEFTARTDLFANRTHLQEGIGLALSPFLPPLHGGAP